MGRSHSGEAQPGKEERTGRGRQSKERKEFPKFGYSIGDLGDKSEPVLDSGGSKQLPTLL